MSDPTEMTVDRYFECPECGYGAPGVHARDVGFGDGEPAGLESGPALEYECPECGARLVRHVDSPPESPDGAE